MIKDDYNINIIGRQTYDGETGEISLSTTGTYAQRGGARFISYKEYDEDDPKVSHTSVLKVEPEKVTLIRIGSDTRLILEKDRRHICLYDTGFGTLSVGVFTSELKNALNSKGGKLKIEYTLDINSSASSKNELSVEVTPRKKLPS